MAAARKFYDPGLDVVRCIACVLVVVHHVVSLVAVTNLDGDFATSTYFAVYGLRLFALGGGLGVLYFFVLSAFLLSRLLMIEQETAGSVSLYKFWMRRCYRIWPLYFFFLGLVAFLQFTTFMIPAFPGGARTASLFGFLYNWWGSDPSTPSSLVAILWSVCVEEQFYVLLMIMVGTAGVRTLPWLASGLIVAGLASRAVVAWLAVPYPAMWNYTTSHLDAFGLGILAAWLVPRLTERLRLDVRVLLVVAALAWPLVAAALFRDHVYAGYIAVFTYFVTSMLAVGLILGLSAPERRVEEVDPRDLPPFATRSIPGLWLDGAKAVQRVAVRVMIYLGRRAYGIYVYHWLAMFLVQKLLHPPELRKFTVADAWFTVTATLLFADLSYRFLEQPFFRMKKKFQVIETAPRTEESIFGKLKRPEGDYANDGFTGLTVTLGAFLGEQTEEQTQKALEAVPKKETESWVKKIVGTKLQMVRRFFVNAGKS